MSFKKTYFDEGKFFIRNLKKSDINNNYLNWFKDKNNTKFIVESNFKDLKDLKKYYKNQIKKKNIFFGIFESKTNKHIGNIKFNKINIIKKTAFVGIFLGNTSFQNKSLGSKSLTTACDQIYKKLKIFKIYLGVVKKNVIAFNSYKNAGFYECKNVKKKYKFQLLERNYFLSKLTIGTANFGNNYGIVSNRKLSRIEQNKIFILSKRFNISSYDLAEAYNLNFRYINNLIPKNSKVYLKLLDSFKNFSIKKILRLKNYFYNKLVYFMIHDSRQINFKNKNIKRNLIKLSKSIPLGISVYSPSEAQKAYKFFRFKSIQVPVNIFDQRFLSQSMLRFFKKNNIQFCARSIYLQGVLLQNKKFINKNFPQFQDNFTQFFNHFNKNLNMKKKFITHFIFQNTNIHKVVVGFENSQQLKNLISILNENYDLKKINSLKFKINKLKLIDPTKWTVM